MHDENSKTVPKELKNVSERIGERSEQRVRENLPKGAPDGPNDPSGKTAVRGDVQRPGMS